MAKARAGNYVGKAQQTVKTPFSTRQTTVIQKSYKARLHEANGPNVSVRTSGGIIGWLIGRGK